MTTLEPHHMFGLFNFRPPDKYRGLLVDLEQFPCGVQHIHIDVDGTVLSFAQKEDALRKMRGIDAGMQERILLSHVKEEVYVHRRRCLDSHPINRRFFLAYGVRVRGPVVMSAK